MQSVIHNIRHIRRYISGKNISVAFGIAAVIFAGYICFWQLGRSVLENWDESWYAEMTRNMLRTRNIITLTWNKTTLLDKPPLQIWLNSLFSSLFGLNATSVRLTSALAGFSTVILTARFAYRKWGLLPAVLAFITVLLNNVFIWRTRTGNLDALVTLLIFLIFLVIQSRNRYRHIMLGIIFGLLYLSKVSLVVFPIVVFIIHELIYRKKQITKNWRQYIVVFAIPLLLGGVWLYLGYLQIGSRFPRYYLFSSDQGVVSKMSLQNLKIDYILYAYYSLQRRYFPVLIAGAALAILSIRKSVNFLLLAFSFFLMILLTFSPQKNNWYLMPSMPFWSLLIGYAISEMMRLTRKKTILFWFLILLTVTLSAYVSLKTYRENIVPMIEATGPASQAESGYALKNMTLPQTTVIRVDGLYPSTVFYADRKIKSIRSDSSTSDIFIGTIELKQKLSAKQLAWFVGSTDSINAFLDDYRSSILGTPVLYHIKDETIVEIR